MPPERKAPTGKDTTTVEDMLGDAPGPDAIDPEALFMEAVQNDNDSDLNPFSENMESEQEAPNYEEELQVEEEHGHQEVHADGYAQEEEQQENDEQVGEVVLSQDAYERILSMLGVEDEEFRPELKSEAKEEAKEESPAPEVKPIAASNFKLPETYDELIEMQSDPEKYAEHIHALIQNAVEHAVSSINPLISQRSLEVYAAQKFEEEFFSMYPDVPVPIAIKACAAAQKKLGPDASKSDLLKEMGKNCEFAMNVARSMKKADSRTTARAGRNAPQTTRRSRPTLNGKKVSPTEEVLSKINSPANYDAQTLQLLRDVGTM